MLCLSSACFPGCCSKERRSSNGRDRNRNEPSAANGSAPAQYDVWASSMISTVGTAVRLPQRELAMSSPVQDVRSTTDRGLRLEPDVFARRLHSAGPGLESTPRGDNSQVFKYYCPLCMCYFKGIFEANCCRHYVCYDCLLAYVAGKYGVSAEDLPFLEVPFLFALPCPHCSSMAFEPAPVSRRGSVRSYEDETDVSDTAIYKQQASMHSPVRPGDSFEALQRKMLRYNPSEPPTPAESMVSTLADSEVDEPVARDSSSVGMKRELHCVSAAASGNAGRRGAAGVHGEEEEEEGAGVGGDASQLVIHGSPSAAML